ncbi:putative dehydrogenase [Motilibacter peucedani]|uniref:Putative dehydrogenase n=1 Tax=Motilibacter peucedani TaxID=598650 RepID=A0A420XTN7_9ACTN|nr:Gfo/Idh/MocA family oxidoreductase [Motilibacter peucedani]RKS80206.1 putative dehydrogenase [Motilibacter peucedani]
MGQPLRVGVVGAGKISGAYLSTFPHLPQVAVTAVADLDADRARAAVAEHPGARACTVEELLAADDVDLVLNLTIPAAHASVAHAALDAGKHVYGEKPLALTTSEAAAVVQAAETAGLRLGCAPDTVLGTGVQTARAAVEAGLVGTPVAATAFMTTPGHERWHPDPEFYYRPGGGPLYDMGPYYLSALVHLLGPVRRVVGTSSRPRPLRTIGSGPRAGASFESTVDTHVTGLLEHESGAVTTMVMSFDVWAAALPRIEVYGTDGSLSVPDPNYFDGDVRVFRAGAEEWETLPASAGYVGAGRGVGVADLARSLAQGEPHRASAGLALHVLDVMEALLEAAVDRVAREISTTCDSPALVGEQLAATGTS